MKKLIMSLAAVMVLATPSFAKEIRKDITITRADGTKAAFNVEMAFDAYKHERGLMYRTELAANDGMLFVYDDPGLRAFWMKNTLIPLDMLFFTVSGELVDIRANAKPKDLTPYAPDRADICAILEIKGGEAQAQNLKIGDKLVLEGATACLPDWAGSRTLPTKRPKLGGGV